jgi:GT2 family glycosyltransferase
MNRALETVNARYVLFLNSATEILEGSLGGLICGLDDRPEIGLAGARQLRKDGAPAPSLGRFPTATNMLAEALGLERLSRGSRVLGGREPDPHRYDLEHSCDWISGFMLARGTALESVGWFDERLFNAEEIDFCWRLKRAGWEILHTPAVTVRRHDLGVRQSARTEARAAFARMQFVRKHFPLVAADYRWALALIYGLRVGVFSLLSRSNRSRREGARAALATVLKGRVPYDERSAL